MPRGVPRHGGWPIRGCHVADLMIGVRNYRWYEVAGMRQYEVAGCVSWQARWRRLANRSLTRVILRVSVRGRRVPERGKGKNGTVNTLSIMAEPLSPDHVFNFPANDPTLELEDPAMEVEEDPIEDLKEDLDMDIDEDEEDEWEEDDDWLMALVTPPRAASLTRSETPPLPIDPIMLSGYQITTSDFLPWIPLTQPSTYEVGGPSSAVPKAPHPVGRPLSIVASRVALHHREIRALCVRADKMKDMQTRALSLVIKVDGVSDAQVADSIAIT
ncbi:hypothetical protein Tco_0183765 [Tanacetum coccineum]